MKRPVQNPTYLKWTVPRRLLMWCRLVTLSFPWQPITGFYSSNSHTLVVAPLGVLWMFEGRKKIVVELPPPLYPNWRRKVDSEYFSGAPPRNKYNLVPIYGPMAKCLVSLASVLRTDSRHSSNIDGRSETVPPCVLWLYDTHKGKNIDWGWSSRGSWESIWA